MIVSFADKATAALFESGESKRIDANLAAKARKRLDQLDAATTLGDLAFPPGNDLKKRRGEDSWQIRVDRQWRITFVWRDGEAHDVRFWDPH